MSNQKDDRESRAANLLQARHHFCLLFFIGRGKSLHECFVVTFRRCIDTMVDILNYHVIMQKRLTSVPNLSNKAVFDPVLTMYSWFTAKSESMHVLFTSTILRQTFNSAHNQSYEIPTIVAIH
jgi:hypothetical protein